MPLNRVIWPAAAAIAALATAVAADEAKPYPFKSAVVRYTIGGNIQRGTETLYLSDYGRRTRTERDTTMTILGKKSAQRFLEIDDGTWHWTIDLNRKTGEKRPSYSLVARRMLTAMTPEQKMAMEKLGKELVSGFTRAEEMKGAGTGKVLGKECAIYDMLGVRTWQWNKLELKRQSPELVKEAVELSMDVTVPAGKFTPPAGISFIEIPPGEEAPAPGPASPAPGKE